jgi:hypothetical protein
MTKGGGDEGQRTAFQHLRLEDYQRVHVVINGFPQRVASPDDDPVSSGIERPWRV